MVDLDERIGRLEGALDGLRHSQNMLLGAIGLVAAIVLGVGVYGLQRIDNLNDAVNALPGQISAELRDISQTLAESITAARQSPPQVILMPPPDVRPPIPVSPKSKP